MADAMIEVVQTATTVVQLVHTNIPRALTMVNPSQSSQRQKWQPIGRATWTTSATVTSKIGVDMVEVRPGVNEFELLVVLARLLERGTEHAVVQPGNACVWVSSGSSSCPINEYWIFSKGQVVDIQID